MAPHTDPYRTLGLERGASLDEVKRAYRRLAKANHPDAAGEAALPRFLAIQAAYDQIAGPDARLRRGAGGAARRPWQADDDRAGATHRAYAGRSRTRPGPRPRPAGPPPGTRSGRPPRADRPPNKATLGSTSYDGADAEPFEPDWGGASWYGTSSGTYWTLNPKEYADPRKHGPEYQARARRTSQRGNAASQRPPETLAGEAESETETDARAQAEQYAGAHERGAGEPTRTSGWWATGPSRPNEATSNQGSATFGGLPRPPQPPRSSAAGGTPAATDDVDISSEAIIDSIRTWLDDRRPGVGARVGRAVVGWAPIALGIGWIAGEISGCGRYSADCHPGAAPISWATQLAVLVLLIAVTRLARIATVATIATLAAVLPATVLLVATSDPDSMEAGRAILGGLMVIAWAAGLAYGAVREFRKPIERPVS